MAEQRMQSFEEFWPFYVAQHKKKSTRLLHYFGLLLAFVSIAVAFNSYKFWWLCLAPVFGYGFAWFAHYFVEKNTPATFTYFWWSILGDFRMFFLMSLGKMDSEINKILNRKRRVGDAR